MLVKRVPREPRAEIRTAAAAVTSSTVRVLALSIGMVLAAGLLFAGWVRHLPGGPAPYHVHWLVLAATFAASEVFVIHLQFRRDAHSISLSEIPIIVGLLFASPLALILCHLVGAGLTLVLHRRQPMLKLAFILSKFTIEACVGVLAFHAVLGSSHALGPRLWLAAFAATVTVALLSALSVTLVMSLHVGRLQPQQMPKVMAAGVIIAIVNSSLGLVAVTAVWNDVRAVSLLLIVAVVVLFAFRAYSSLATRHASLELLYEFTKVVGRSARAEDVISVVLGQAREMLRAERAELVLLPAAGEVTGHRVSVGPGEHTEQRPDYAFDDLDAVGERAMSKGGLLVVPRSTRSPELRAYLARNGYDDCIIAPLHGDEGVIGMVVVANRLGDVSTFDLEDGKLFETIANHASVALQNGRLMDRLRFEAMHDSLTGLPNRTYFHSRVRDAISRAKISHGTVAVMLMDLDRFKEVNDSLGHHNGDVLLQEVGVRMRQNLEAQGLVARLGGDEFGILLPSVSGVDEAIAAAQLIGLVLDRPFRHQELSLEVGATIGIALFPDHGDDASTLLQRADVAMYAAKEKSGGLEVYDAGLDHYSPRRLALVGELRRAIEQEQLAVYYQPKADLDTGIVTGAEALVRWNHPEYGFLPPDDFIPLAEHTGLIGPLTTYVLRVALRQCHAWQQLGMDMSIAVNLSARSLLDITLPNEIASLLHETDVPAASLMLEITESSVMTDPGRTIAVLNELSAMGVQLSVDDFGTGYSSLSYLKRLPVNEVKIDKSFVLTMSSSESEAAIVRSIVDLGRNLKLHVLAEGVEDQETWDRLKEMGCHGAQGFHLGRPQPAIDLTRWLGQHTTIAVAV
jgi:diguanylate cyclase (GGDEF)-like protein